MSHNKKRSNNLGKVESAIQHLVDDTSTPIDEIIEELDRERITTAGGRPFVCDICGRGFVRRTNMMRHRVLHTGDDRLQVSTSYFNPDEPSTR